MFGGCWRFIRCLGLLAALAPLRRGHQRAVLAIRRKHAMETGKVDSWLWHQCRQAGNEIQRLKDHMRGAMPKALATLAGQAFPVRRLELVTDVAIRRE